MRLSYRVQLLLAFTVLLLLGGTGATLVLSRWLTSELEEVAVRQARYLANNLATWSEDAVLTEDRVELYRLLRSTKEANEEVVYVFVHGPERRVLAHTLAGGFPEQLGEVTEGRMETLLKTELGQVLDVRSPILEGRSGDVHVGYSQSRVLASVERMQSVLWLIAVPIFVVGIAAVWIVSGYLTRPALKVAEVVRRFGSGDLGARVEEHFSGEIGTLAEAFNTMAANLERQANELRYLTEYNQNLIDNLGAGLYVVDADQRIKYANREIVQEVGDVIGRRCHEVLCRKDVPCAACVSAEAREGSRVVTRTCDQPGGRWVEQTAIPIRTAAGSASTVVTRRDITEAVRLRDQMTQHEKLAAVGELAAVVAHEVNNPLDGMHALVRIVVNDPATSEESRGHLAMVEEGLSRMEMIVKRLLTFTADSTEPSVTADLADQVERALAFVRKRLSSAGVDTSLNFGEGPCRVRIDPNRFPQVIVNLVLNAADAMPDGGLIKISSTTANGGVRLSFEDEGPGIPEHLRELIFQPFFTTKGRGKGTGLGLAVSRRIVEGHGGRLTVRTSVGGGAAFDLWIPTPAGRDKPVAEVPL